MSKVKTPFVTPQFIILHAEVEDLIQSITINTSEIVSYICLGDAEMPYKTSINTKINGKCCPLTIYATESKEYLDSILTKTKG